MPMRTLYRHEKSRAKSRLITSDFRSELAEKNYNFSFTWPKFMVLHITKIENLQGKLFIKYTLQDKRTLEKKTLVPFPLSKPHEFQYCFKRSSGIVANQNISSKWFCFSENNISNVTSHPPP